MKNLKHVAQKYIDWVIKLGRFKFSLLGITLIAVLAVGTQIILSIFITGAIDWGDLLRSIIFGLISAPFVIYFFTLLVEKLELSRINLAKSVDELQQEIKERILAEQRLEQINRDKTMLMATISHELRTPLNGIIGLSRILLDSHLSEQQLNYLKTISVSAISLGHIFNDIIDLEKIDGHKIELCHQAVDFYAFLNDIINIGHLMAEQKQLKFELQYGENLAPFLFLDCTRLNQILWNLLSNATKFTEEGSVCINVQRLSQNEYTFTVTDTGLGIPSNEIDKIFTMYYQVEKDKCKFSGSGIGLAVSKYIANLMNGDLTVESQVGKGSTFTLKIQAEETIKPLVENILPTILPNLYILLVEDIELNIVVAKSVLEKLNYKVDVAMTGQEAIEKFEQNKYDLVLLDIQLPDMSGFQVSQQLRRNYEDGKYDFFPPLIALTANVIHNKFEYQQQGIDDVLRKPLSVKALNRCLSEYFAEDILNSSKQSGSKLSQPQNNFDANFIMLNDLIEMLGVQFVKDNLILFKQIMPEYVDDLKTIFQRYIQDSGYQAELIEKAHKIKSAAASIGLNYIQQLAEQIQQDELIDWEKHIAKWVKSLEQDWADEVEKLEQWLANK